jgi:hypothetical protein
MQELGIQESITLDASRPEADHSAKVGVLVPAMHAGASDYDNEWLDACRTYKTRNGRTFSPSISIVKAIWDSRPLCGCGCGERLPAPVSIASRGIGFSHIYWEKNPYIASHRPGGRFKNRIPPRGTPVIPIEELRESLSANAPNCICGCGQRLTIADSTISRARSIEIASYRCEQSWKKNPYFRGHGIRQTKFEKHEKRFHPISLDERGLILGTLLGDFSIGYAHSESLSPRLSGNHGIDQDEYCQYKARRLASQMASVEIKPNPGYGKLWSCFRGRSHPGLREIYATTMPMGKKTVTREWLEGISEEGMAWWYMDDGSLSVSGNSLALRFHTEGFSEQENHTIADWLTGKGFSSTVCRARNYFYVSVCQDGARRWIRQFGQYSIPCMDYKFLKS